MQRNTLVEILRKKDENLHSNLERIRKAAAPLLSKITETFPEYTDHTIAHSDRIIVSYETVVPDSLKKQLNKYEIYFLVAGAYLHDIGMVNFREFSGGVLGKPEIDNIRSNHHLRSEDLIIRKYRQFSIENDHQARIIGRICRGHRQENLASTTFDPSYAYEDCPINIPLLAAFLRIADELDITFERASWMIYENIPPTNEVSKNEWERHLSISGVALNPRDPIEIKCSATCKSPSIHRMLKTLEKKISEELADLPNHLHHYWKYKKDLPGRFVIKITPEGYLAYDFRFSLETMEIIRFFSRKLYERKEESLRELLKNSVDACRYRRFLLKESGLSYTPEIVFQLTSDNDLIVSDNGLGMDEDIIENYLTRVGRSFYTSPDFLERRADFTPVSELGIGLLSYLMMTDKIQIETRKDNSEPLLIEIADISDYFFVRKGLRADTGTTMTLHLQENIGEEIDLEEEIRYYARHLEFPVKVILPNSEVMIVDMGFKSNIMDLLEGHYAGRNDIYPHFMEETSRLFNEKYVLHLIEIDNEVVEGKIGILFEKNDVLSLKPIVEWKNGRVFKKAGYMVARGSGWINMERFFLSSEGIFIGNINILPKWLEENLIFADLNLKNMPVDLNLPRNNIEWNSKSEKLISHIERIIVENLENLLYSLKEKTSKCDVYNSKEIFEDFFVIYVFEKYREIYRNSQLYKNPETLHSSENLLNFIKGYCPLKYISKKGISYTSFDEISDRSSIILLRDLGKHTEEHIKQVISECSGFKEDELYLLPHFDDFNTKDTLEFLLENIQPVSLLSFIEMENSNEMEDLVRLSFPLRIVRFKNYRTSRLVEFLGHNDVILNRENRFIDLLIRHKNFFDNKRIIEGLFDSLRYYLLGDSHHSGGTEEGFKKIVERQKEILENLIEADLISENEKDSYILAKNDFPPHLVLRKVSTNL